MTPLEILDIGKEAIWVFLKVTVPILGAALIVGLIISLFQALTQIQESTLSFVPKIIAVFLVLLISMSYIAHEMHIFTDMLVDKIINIQ